MAYDAGFRRDRAVLKVQALSPDDTSEFLEYCEHLKALRSVFVATPYAFGVFDGEDGRLYGFSARPYLPGMPLSSIECPLPSNALIRIGAQLAIGLGACHRSGILHRDLKPGNAVLQRAGEGITADSMCVLIDLPYRPKDDDQSLREVTLQYVAPELAAGRGADQRSDLFSLGVLLYRLATGTLPFSSESVTNTLRAQRNRQYRPVLLENPKCDRNVARVIEQLLEPHPQNRPDDADTVLALLQQDLALPQNSFVAPRVSRAPLIDGVVSAIDCHLFIRLFGASGSGVTTVLADLHDVLESTPRTYVFSVRPRNKEGQALADQLAEPLGALARMRVGPSAAPRKPQRRCRTATEVLDDLHTATKHSRIVILVDQWHQCDVSERSFLSRIVRQEIACRRDSVERQGACKLVCGASGGASAESSIDDLTRLCSMEIGVPAFSVDEVAELFQDCGSSLRLSTEHIREVHARTDGMPRSVVNCCNRIVTAVAAGASVSRAVRESLEFEYQTAPERDGGERYKLVHAAMALWLEPLGAEACRSLVRTLCPQRDTDAVLADLGSFDLVESDEEHSRVQNVDLGLRLLSRLGTARLRELFAALVVATGYRAERSTRAALRLVECATRCAFPSEHRWAIRSALLRSLRAGRFGEVEYACRSLESSALGRDRSWLRVVRRAAAVEAGRTASDDTLARESDASSTAFHVAWIEARRLRRGRYRREAHELLLQWYAIGASSAGGFGFLEDFGVTSAELGLLDSARTALRDIAHRVWTLAYERTPRRSWIHGKRTRHPIVVRGALAFLRVRQRLAIVMKRYGLACRIAQQELQLVRQNGDKVRQAACLNNEGLALLHAERPLQAVEAFLASVMLRETSDDERGLVVALNNLSAAYSQARQFGRAVSALNRARMVADRNGLLRHRDLSMLNLGLAYFKRGQLRESRRAFRGVRRSPSCDAITRRRATYNTAIVAIEEWRLPVARQAIKRLASQSDASTDGGAPIESLALSAEVAIRTEDRDAIHAASETGLVECHSDIHVQCESALRRAALVSVRRLPLVTRMLCRANEWYRDRKRLSGASLERVLRVARTRGSNRSALAWMRAFAGNAAGAAEARKCSEHLSRTEFREGNDDLNIETRALLASVLMRCDKTREAWALLRVALKSFRSLERKLACRGPIPPILRRLSDLLLGILVGSRRGGSVRHRPFSAALQSAAFDALTGGSGIGEGQGIDVLRACGDAIASSDVAASVPELLKVAEAGTGAQRAILIATEPDGKHVVRESTGRQRAGGHRVEISWAVVSKVLLTGEASLFDDALTADQLASHRSVAAFNLRSLACVPIVVNGEALGVLYLDHQGIAGLFTESDLGLLRTVAAGLGLLMKLESMQQAASLSDERLAEARTGVIRAERIGIAGELATGIAHDLKNVLATIIARCQLMSLQDGNASPELGAIERAAQTGASMIERVQECAREGDEVCEPVDIVEVARDVFELIRPRLDRRASTAGVAVELRVTAEGPVVVNAGVSDIRDLLLNLCVNACDAMPNGGLLEVSVRRDGEGIELVVRDEGVGIPPETQARVFDPFFSTKGKEGTGLGLSVVHKTVLKYGGTVSVTSECGAGTSFVIRMPGAIGGSYEERVAAIARQPSERVSE